MKRVLYYDCFAGISGDMNLGALVDLGVDPAHLEKELAKLDLKGFHLEVGGEIRKGIHGTRVRVVIEDPDNEKHRHLHHIEELIEESSLSSNIKRKSLEIFDRIAEAEARVHAIPKEKVHFHEVGALDSIADIVGAAICQEALEVDAIYASPVQVWGGNSHLCPRDHAGPRAGHYRNTERYPHPDRRGRLRSNHTHRSRHPRCHGPLVRGIH